jgi:hypothetical protein
MNTWCKNIIAAVLISLYSTNLKGTAVKYSSCSTSQEQINKLRLGRNVYRVAPGLRLKLKVEGLCSIYRQTCVFGSWKLVQMVYNLNCRNYVLYRGRLVSLGVGSLYEWFIKMEGSCSI